MQLSENEVLRYSRQLILRGWGSSEQLRLRRLRVGVSVSLPSAALYLAAVGVGQVALLHRSPAPHEDRSGTLPTAGSDAQPLLAHLQRFNREASCQVLPDGGHDSFDYLVLLEDEVQSTANIHKTTASIVVKKTDSGCEIGISGSPEPMARLLLPRSGAALPFDLLAGAAAAELLIYHQLKSTLDKLSKSMSCIG